MGNKKKQFIVEATTAIAEAVYELSDGEIKIWQGAAEDLAKFVDNEDSDGGGVFLGEFSDVGFPIKGICGLICKRVVCHGARLTWCDVRDFSVVWLSMDFGYECLDSDYSVHNFRLVYNSNDRKIEIDS